MLALQSAVLVFFASLISFWKIGATLVSMVALGVFVYAFIRLNEVMKAETIKLGHMPSWTSEKEKKSERWEAIERYMRSNNPSDWKVAIMEADNILDDIVKRMGYPGDTLGERLKMVEASDFPYLDDVWRAHKTRNRIAHTGTDFPLSRSGAEETVNAYYRSFKEMGFL